jgi:hypothetical protein
VADGEQRDDAVPHPQIAEPTVHEHDRGAGARFLVEEAGAVHVHVGHGPTLLLEGVAHHVAALTVLRASGMERVAVPPKRDGFARTMQSNGKSLPSRRRLRFGDLTTRIASAG